MANYALKNIKDLEDSAVQFGLAPQVEARFGRKALAAEKGGFSYQKLEPGYRQGFGHRHEEQEETYIVIAGSGPREGGRRDRRAQTAGCAPRLTGDVARLRSG